MDSERFAKLFAGRVDAYGTDGGGCWRNTKPLCHHDVIDRHLSGSGEPIGVYPMVPLTTPHAYPTVVEQRLTWVVKWGCVDLDVKSPTKRRWDYEDRQEAWTAASNLHRALAAMDLTGWIEATKSGGFHVWVFAEDWVPARTMRRALLIACQLSEVPTTEVNPKAEHFDDPETLGNYVRLPYPGSPQPTANRYVVDSSGKPITSLDEFVDWAWQSRASTALLERAAKLWAPPEPEHHVLVEGTYDGELDDDVTPYIAKVLAEGPLDDGRDRSGWLWWLAGKCRDEGLEPETALEVLRTADDTYTMKYTDRKDGEVRLRETVERAY